MKESIIRISTPIPKVPLKPSEDEPQPEIIQTEEPSWTDELQQPELEPEPVDIALPTSPRYATPYSSGWKVSDILREIRLHSFEMGNIN